MRRSTSLVAAGIAAFLLFLVAFLPASLLLQFLPPNVRLEGVSGTVWRGRAEKLSLDPGVAGAPARFLGSLRWSNRPWRLFLLQLDYGVVLSPPGGEVAFDLLTRTGRRLEFGDVRGRFPVAAVQGLISPAGWSGEVELDVTRLVVERGYPTAAEGFIVVRDVKAPGPDGRRLGSFELELGAGAVGGEGISGRLQDLGGGTLRVRASLELAPEGNYTLSGEVTAGPDAGDAVLRSLAYLGPADTLGRRPFTIEGTL